VSTQAGDREPVRIPRRPSKRRRDRRPSDPPGTRAHTPARPDRGAFDYATAKRDRRWRGWLAIYAAELSQLWTADAPSLHTVWDSHLHSARIIWKPVAQPAGPDPEDRLIAAITGPPETATAHRPSDVARWMYRISSAWGALHLVIVALAYLVTWILRGPVGGLLTVGGLALLAWHPW
jgi:hypothetical protein